MNYQPRAIRRQSQKNPETCESTFDLTDVPASNMIEKLRLDVLTLFTTFLNLAISRNFFSKAETRQFGVVGTEGLANL